MALGDPVYLAIVDDDTLRSVVSGASGHRDVRLRAKRRRMLTDEQVNAIIRGVRKRWSKPSALAGVTLLRMRPRCPEIRSRAKRRTRAIALLVMATAARGGESGVGYEFELSRFDHRPGAAHDCHHGPSRLRRSRLARQRAGASHDRPGNLRYRGLACFAAANALRSGFNREFVFARRCPLSQEPTTVQETGETAEVSRRACSPRSDCS